MRFEAVTYIEWAKAHDGYKRSLGWSFTPQRSLTELQNDFGFDLEKLQIWPEPNTTGRFTALRDLIAERYGLLHQQVLPVSSCTLANFLGMAAVLDSRPEDARKVLVESPTYTPLLQQIRSAGGHVEVVPTWHNGRHRPESLRQAIHSKTALVVLTNLSNPTGTFIKPDDLAEICDSAANHGAFVLVDEVYRDFIDSEQIAPAVLCGPNGISTESLSKIHGLAQLKVGWLMGPPAIIARASQIYDHLSVSVPFVCQEIARQVLESHWDTLVRDARSFCARRLELVNRFMAGRKDLRWHAPAGGLIGLVEPLHVDAETLAKHMLEEHKTVMVPGRFFGAKKHLRIGFGGPDLEESLELLAQSLDTFGTSNS
jgi:aspartate/methionine/tyrosine aminotransferase